MKRFLQEIVQALDSGLYLLALQACTTLPDMCGALMSEDGIATKKNYKNWYDQYGQTYLDCWLSAEDCYIFRSSIVHQAKTIPSPRGSQKAEYSRIIFTVPGPDKITLHNNIINGVLNLDITIFCKGMITAAENWIKEMERTQDINYAKNLSDFMSLYPNGFSPYIVGVPVVT